MPNVTVHDNGAAYMIQVDGLVVHASVSLGDAWRHIEWMHKIETQKFTVGKNKVPVEKWISMMHELGYLD